jgi:hydrocephalus-inducing protein
LKVVLENRGDIELEYNLRETRGVFGPSFRFKPSAGHLNVGEQVRIDVFFAPDNLGSIYEEFEWDLNGASEPLLLTFKGKCVGPNIHSNIDKINFGKVSFGFSSSIDFQIINTSQISVNYEICLKGDADDDIKDFTISNQSGIIDELSNKSVRIQLNASQVKVYNLWLVVDVCNVQKEVLKIPIIASVMVPTVRF